MKHHFNLDARIREKQVSRERDDADLAAGRVSAAEMQARNSFVSGLDIRGAELEIRKPLR